MNLKTRTPIRVQSFNRGQFSGYEPTTVPKGASTVAENVLIDRLGQAPQRTGLTRVGDNPAALISQWTFDASSSVDDKASNDGTDTDVTYVDGMFGKCAEFSGTTSKITVDAATTIDATSMGTFTLSAWIYIDTDGGSDVGRIFDKWSGTKVGYRFWVHTESASTVKLSFEVGYGTTNSIVITSTTMSTGAWHRVEAVHQSNKSSDIFIDGAVATYGTDTTGVGTVGDDSAVDLTIGNETAASTKGFDGKIDDPRIYTDARSAAEVVVSKTYGIDRFRVPGTIDRQYFIQGGTLWRLDDNFLGKTSIDAGFTANKTTNFITGRVSDGTYVFFILNGNDNVHSMTTGEAITDEGDTNTDPPKSTQGEWHDSRLFLINSTGDINYSDILDGQTFNRATNIFRSKNPAKAIKSFKEKELIIYLTKGIQVLNTTGATPLTEWSLNLFNEDVEFNSPRSVANVGDDQIFLANDGVRVLSRTEFDKISSGLISQPIQDVIDTINQDVINTAVARFVNNRYILAIPTGTNTEPDTVIIWDALASKLAGTLSAGWTVIPSGDWDVSDFSDMEFGDNVTSLVVADSRAVSLIYQGLKGNTDNGTAIASKLAGVDHVIDRVTDGIWDPVHVVAQSGVNTSITTELELNRTGFVEIGTMSLVGSTPTLPIALPFDLGGTARARKLFRSKALGRGRTARVQLSHSTYNVKPTYVEYTLYTRPLNPRII